MLFIGGIGLLFVPRPYSTMLLLALLFGMFYISVRSAGQGWQPVKSMFANIGMATNPIFQVVWQWVKAHRQQLAYPTAIAAVAFVVFSAYTLRPETAGLPVSQGAFQWIVGGFLLGAAIWLSDNKLFARPQYATALYDAVIVKTRWLSLATGSLLFALIMWVNALPYRNEYDFPINDPLPLNVHAQVIVWLLSVVLITRGLIGTTETTTSKLSFPELINREFGGKSPLAIVSAFFKTLFTPISLFRRASLPLKLEILAFSAIMIVTFALRTYNLELVHRFVDEVHWFDAVPRVWDHSPTIRIFYPFSNVTAFTWIYPYFESVFVSVLGANFTAMRLLSAIVGTLGVAAVYYLARVLFDRPTALLGALLLAVFPPHIQFSRIALNNIADPLFGTLALAFLAHGMKTYKRSYFVLAGVILGLTQYFYEGGRLLYPPLLGVFAFYNLLQPVPKIEGENKINVQFRSWRLIMNLLLLAFAAIIIALPVYTTLAAHDLPLTMRLSEQGYDSRYWTEALSGVSNIYWVHLLEHTLVYFQIPELGWFYGGDTALLLPILVPFFFLGLWHAFWRIRQSGMFLLILWLVAATVGTSLTRDLWSARYVVAFPALLLFVALGIRCMLPLLAPLLGIARNLLRDDEAPADARPVFTRSYLRLTTALMVIIVAVLGVAQVNYFFGEHLEVYNHQARFGGDVHDALFRAVNLPAGTHVHIITDQALFRFDIDTVLRFWDREDDLVIDMQPRNTLTNAYLMEQPLGLAHAFFIEPGDDRVLAMVREFFVLDPPRVSPYGVPAEYQMILYYAQPGSRINR